MNTFIDPLIDTQPDRLRFSTGEMLGADDFDLEQTYHRRQLARSLLYSYGSGVLAGMEVAAEFQAGADGAENEVEIVVKPGLAIDRLGRLIEISRDLCLRLNRWFKFISDPERSGDRNKIAELRNARRDSADGGIIMADIFLSFHPSERERKPAFATGPFDELDASQPSRTRDAWELNLVIRSRDDALKTANTEDPWAVIQGADPAERLQSARNASLRAWENMAPPPSGHGGAWKEVPAGIDPTSVLLARIRIPSGPLPNNEMLAPPLLFTPQNWAGDNVDNTVRNFILPPPVIRRVAGF
jgi:hypothetical protein